MFSKVVLSSYCYVPITEIKHITSMTDSLTAHSKFGETDVPLYDVSHHGWFGFPRHHFNIMSRIAEETIDKRPEGKSASFEFTSILRPGQIPVTERFVSRLSRGVTGFLLEAKPAFGKTVCVAWMLAHIGRKALVVVPRSNLVKQWRDRMLEHTSLKPFEVGTAVSGKLKDSARVKVVIGLVHSLALDRFGIGFRKQFGVVVFDEVDRSLPPTTFSPVIGMIPARIRIGASASMVRQDGLDLVFREHLGESTLYGLADERVSPTILVHNFPTSSGGVPRLANKLAMRGMLISKVAKSIARNLVICDYLKLIYNSERRCVLLSDRKSQLTSIRNLLVQKLKIPGAEIGYYCRGIDGQTMSDEYREKVAGSCKIILATYGMFAIGSDIPDLSGLIYGTPQSEVAQAQGRIERVFDGKKQPVVIDIVDTFYPNARGWAAKRKKYYQDQSLKIKCIN